MNLHITKSKNAESFYICRVFDSFKYKKSI